jgi:hypothetical protein
VVDPQGRQLGSLDGADVFGIPGGSYVREYPLADDVGVGTANGDPTGIKTAYIASPEKGTFQVTATGTALGTYRLTFLAVATDGTIQSTVVTGNAGPGSTSSYQISYSSEPGSEFTVESTTAAAPASGRTCNGTYNGTFVGNVTVSSGQNCIFVGGGITGHVTVTGGSLVLSRATVGNNVQINGGGTFSIGNFSAINGNLEIQNIPAGVALNQVCGTKVAGNLQFHNNGTRVEIGSASPACPGNTIGGNLEVHNNAAATQIFGNTVNGNLQEHNNTASTQASSNAVGSNMEVNSNTAATQVFSNTITNNLQCQNNTSITGGGNTAKRKQGQCASF